MSRLPSPLYSKGVSRVKVYVWKVLLVTVSVPEYTLSVALTLTQSVVPVKASLSTSRM